MKIFLIYHLLLVITIFIQLANTKTIHLKKDPDEYSDTPTLIQSKGYQAQEHQVITDDGYILKIHRIPFGKTSNNSTKKRPVALLQHGLLDVDSTWVINFPQQSLGFILADAGYDVWLGSVRGDTNGLGHVKFNSSIDEEFWDFSFNEMAKFDLSAMIYYILNQTHQSDLFYVGHSQGTLIGFILFTEPEIQKRVKLFLALGPVANVGHITSPIRYLADIGAPTRQQVWYDIFGRKDFLPEKPILQWLADKGCNNAAIDKIICGNLLFIISGPSFYLNESRYSVYLTHDPAGTSTKNLIHFAQMYSSKNYQMYDFGTKGNNLKHYNQTEPPLYDLNKVQVPVALYWAVNDWLADPKDVEFLRQNLPNIVDDYEVLDWNHLDFVWAVNTKQEIYDRMVKLMDSYI